MKSVFCAKEWLDGIKKEVDNDKRKARRRVIQAGTFSACTNGYYYLENGEKVDLDTVSLFNSSKMTENFLYESKFKGDDSVQVLEIKIHEKKDFETKVFVIEGDCLETSIWLKKKYGCEPLCLNMASDKTPGGGYRGGAGAQEENLHRRTNLFMCLEDPDYINKRQWKWPLPPLCTIYSPNVIVFRGSEAKGYPFLEKPVEISILSSCAIRRPELKKSYGKEIDMAMKDKDLTTNKMRMMIRVAILKKHTCLVLSAYGCGAFKNPPNVIARLFKEIMDEKEFKGQFEYIAFSIIDDHNSGKSHNGEGNVTPFCKAFGVERFDITQ